MKKNRQLDQDGFCDNLYLLLWKKDPIFSSKPSINIPNTILIRYQRIYL